MKKSVRTGIWLGVSLAALVFLGYKTYRDAQVFESFKQAMTTINWTWAAGALVLQLAAQSLLAARWRVLLHAQGVAIGLYQAIKLTYLGLFYNNVMPGGIGGDLLKAWYITHHSQRHLRVEAAVTVFVDRVIGLVGTILMAGVASLFLRGENHYLQVIRWIVWGLFAAMVLTAVVFGSRRLRRVLFISQLLRKLPFQNRLYQVDNSLRIYRRHGRQMGLCLGLTVVLQGLTIVAVWILSQALHLYSVRLVHCLMLMPMVWLIGAAIPVPGGLGIIENSIKYLFCVVINPDDWSAAAGDATALAVLNRVVLLYLGSIPGALVPLFGGHLPKAEEIERDLTGELESGDNR